LRWMLPIKILDTQAGLKGFTAKTWNQIGAHIVTDGFFFDVELLAYAGAANLTIKETPIYFEYVDPTTVRMVKHGWSMILDTIRLRWRLRHEPRKGARPAGKLVTAGADAN
jgi:hypothetical protein